MGVFIVLLVVPILLQHITIKGYYIDYQKRNNAALAFFFCLLALLVMLRHESIGSDTKNYIHFFRRFSTTDWSALQGRDLEIGFAYFNKIVSLLHKSIRSNPNIKTGNFTL